MIIRPKRLGPGGSLFEGEEPAETFDVEDHVGIRSFSALRYRLDARLVTGELIVRGTVEADVDLECSGCGVFFSTTISDPSFLRAYEIHPGEDEVSVTDDLREAVLLSLPAYPRCAAACPGAETRNRGPNGSPPEAGPWDALDRLEL
jgi:uncharacterized protein